MGILPTTRIRLLMEPMAHTEHQPTTTLPPEPTAFPKLSPALTERPPEVPPITLTREPLLATPRRRQPTAAPAQRGPTIPTREPTRPPNKVPVRRRSGEVPWCRTATSRLTHSTTPPHKGP